MPTKTIWTGEEDYLLKKHYHKKKAKEIAKLLNNKTEKQVLNRAGVFGLTVKRKKLKGHEEELVELHAMGLCDRDIAYRIGVKRYDIVRWRKKLNLPANFPVGEMKDSTREMAVSKQRMTKAAKRHDKKKSDMELGCRDRTSKIKAHGILGVYEDEDREFLQAISLFRNENRGRAPTLVEGFRIAKFLGWEKLP